MTNELNAREELEAAANWLGFHHEDLNFGLRNAEDGLKLWRYWMARPELPEFCDGADTHEKESEPLRHVKKSIGYDPWSRQASLP